MPRMQESEQSATLRVLRNSAQSSLPPYHLIAFSIGGPTDPAPRRNSAQSRWHGARNCSFGFQHPFPGEVAALVPVGSRQPFARRSDTRHGPRTSLRFPVLVDHSRQAEASLRFGRCPRSKRSRSALASREPRKLSCDSFLGANRSHPPDRRSIVTRGAHSWSARSRQPHGARAEPAWRLDAERSGTLAIIRARLGTPREVRNALVYVLLNFRKHLRVKTGTDPRSSAAWFEGWLSPPPLDECSVCPCRAASRPGSEPLAGGRAGGLIDQRQRAYGNPEVDLEGELKVAGREVAKVAPAFT